MPDFAFTPGWSPRGGWASLPSVIARQKIKYPVSQSLRQYLYHFDRQREIPKVYEELKRFSGAIPYEDPSGRETLWMTVMYPPEVTEELRPRLTSGQP